MVGYCVTDDEMDASDGGILCYCATDDEMDASDGGILCC